MKKLLLLLFALLFVNKVFPQVIIAKWTFESTSLLNPSTGQTLPISGSSIADEGVNAATSSFTGLHNASSTWATPSGNGSSQSISSNNWTTGDYYEFKTSTTGYNNIFLSFDAFSSNSGPRDFKVQYSIDNGGNWTDVPNSITNATYITNAANASGWANVGRNSTFIKTLNMSPITALNNQASVSFRLVCNSNTSVSGGTVGTAGTSRVDNVTISNYEVLPVSLSSFTATANLQNVDLAWSTAGEKNNSHFDILRSGDGKTFTKIDEVKGAGTTDATKNYTYIDRNALPGISYYQLKQVDNDGTPSLSDVAVVKSNVGTSNFRIFSNKQEGTVKLIIFAANEGKGSLKIYDLNGRKLTEQQLSLSKGYTNVSVPFNGANGLHVASLTTATETVTQKFIQ
ncbi:T9SS type A sorting domain-containing protein [Pedobacter sp. ASV28]|uniref:T9SS type A sorting domain-containing protein n=1 Tax=Pedobacter sp. ASV28 TaxID=2795123 RepID=UPI0018EC8E7C|nr:T9SS type A sorting domain-containing protein [Pedobacter sp. ASV28]